MNNNFSVIIGAQRNRVNDGKTFDYLVDFAKKIADDIPDTPVVVVGIIDVKFNQHDQRLGCGEIELF